MQRAFKALAGINYRKIDVTENPAAHEFVMSSGYLAAPVVYVSPTVHWAGFRPDRLASLANVAA